MYVSVSLDYIQCYFHMDNKLQVLLTLLSLPSAVMWLNSAFYNVTTAFMLRRKDIIRANCDRSRVQRCHQPDTDCQFWVRLERRSAWCDNFINGVVIPEDRRENFHMSRLALTYLNKKVRPHVEGMTTRMEAPMDVFLKVTCTFY